MRYGGILADLTLPEPQSNTSTSVLYVFSSSKDQTPPPPYSEEPLPPMSLTREPKLVAGQMTEGAGKKPKRSIAQKVGDYLREDAERQRNNGIWGGANAH